MKDKPDPIGEQRVVHTPACATPSGVPKGAVNSVFAAGKAAATKRPRLPAIDPMAVVIKTGVPIPPLVRGPGAVSPYRQLLGRMQPGQCVELPPPQRPRPGGCGQGDEGARHRAQARQRHGRRVAQLS